MKKIFLFLLSLALSVTVYGSSVEYSMKPLTVIRLNRLEHSVLGGGLYYRNMKNEDITVRVDAEKVTGAVFLRLKVYCVTFAGDDPVISDSTGNDLDSLRKGGVVENNKTVSLRKNGPVIIIPGRSVGMITGLKGHYFDKEQLGAELEFRFNYEEVHKGYVKVTGYGLFREGKDVSVRLEAERAAKLDAYRNLTAVVSTIIEKEDFDIKKVKMKVALKGAVVIKKEYTDKGVYVTVAMKINGQNGFSSFVKY